MSHYRRNFVPGGTYFFTLVTHRRAPLFEQDRAALFLGSVIRRCLLLHPVNVIAMVLLHDHLHAIWALPSGDDRYAMRWNWIKGEFARIWLADGGVEQPPSRSQAREGRRGIWQRRYWEHTIRDDEDLEHHVDYIHYNPVKHGYVRRPRDWRRSSFHRWAARGHYDLNWGGGYVEGELPGDAGE